MRIVYMGTPDFAVPALECLAESRHEVVAVVTQPDKPKGRSGKMQFPPVKEYALSKGIDVLQPEKVKAPEFYPELAEYAPDVIVVAAFGQILPKSVLELPKYGCLNIHASLLPKYRGAAPIQWAVINGEKETGITIMQMDEGLDTGDILKTCKIALSPEETGGSLFDRLAGLGGPLLLETLEELEAGGIKPVPQNHNAHTYAKMLSRDMGNLDFTKSAEELERLIRGLNPWPSAFTRLDGKILKLWKATVVEGSKEAEAGELILADKKNLVIQCGDKALSVEELQLEGKKRMDVQSFMRGYQVKNKKVEKV